jgi:glycosyltransferase 2 family protein
VAPSTGGSRLRRDGPQAGPASKVSPVRKRFLKLSGTLIVTGLCLAYLIWKIDVRKTAHILANADFTWFLVAFGLALAAVFPMAWRWQKLLQAKGIDEGLGWLLRSYFFSWFAGQILPTSLGGDATRIYQTARRHPGQGGPAAGSVLLERALGGAATLTLAAIGFVLAIGHYDVGPYLYVEAAFVIGTVVLGFALFSTRARRWLRPLGPLLARVKIDKPLRAVYEALHDYRENGRLLLGVFALTVVVQAWRVLAIWAAGKAVGVDLSPRPYYVMGPLLFLVMLVPFTINGLAVRESFFVSFLGHLGVPGDQAFATGFLFFLVSVCLSVPGLIIFVVDTVRGAPERDPLPDETFLHRTPAS